MVAYYLIINVMALFISCVIAAEDADKKILGANAHKTHLFQFPSNNLALLNTRVLYSPGNDFSQELILAGFRRSTSPLALPHLPSDMIYIRDNYGNLNIYGYSGEGLYRICIYGPDIYGLIGFVTEGLQIEESFAYAFRRTNYPYAPPINYLNLPPTHKAHKFNKCHKIGREFTISQPHNSNIAVNNFSPGCECLNQGAENAIIATGISAYGKILLFSPNPHTITQKIKGTPRNTGRVQANVFFGIIFKSFFPQGTVKIHYFPHDKGEGETTQCYYKALYGLDGAYAEVIKRFEILNSAYLFEPLVWDIQKSSQELLSISNRAFYIGLNLLPNFSLNSALTFCKQFHIPLSWNGGRGFSKEELQRLASAAHRRMLNKTEVTTPSVVSTAPYSSSWNNFCLPTGQGEELSWVDAANNEIPMMPRILNVTHRNFFLNYLALRLMEDGAKHQTDSISMKLLLSQVYYSQGNFKQATNWINQAYRQCLESNSLMESLMLVRVYFSQWYGLRGTVIAQGTFDGDIACFASLLCQKQNGAFIEDLLDLEKLKQELVGRFPTVPNILGSIRKIGPDNSRILKNRVLRPRDVDILLDIIGNTTDIEEVSFERALFYAEVDDCMKLVHLYNDEYDEEPISENNYFWSEGRPLNKILEALQKHSHSLRKLNLSEVTFNGCLKGAQVLLELKKLSSLTLKNFL